MSFGIAKQSYLCLDHGKDSHDDLMLWAVRHVGTKSRLTSCDMGYNSRGQNVPCE